MMLTFRRPCADHRETLYAYVDRRERSPRTAAALGHLDRCRACEQELSEVAMAVHALARLRRELETVEPPVEAWMRLRASVVRRPDPWRFRASLGGLATSALLVAVLVTPVSLGTDVTAETSAPLPNTPAELRRENEYLASIRTGSLPPTPREEPVVDVAEPSDGSIVFALYPPEMMEVRKEVPARPSYGRSSQPI